jgi:hypothetical protein
VSAQCPHLGYVGGLLDEAAQRQFGHVHNIGVAKVHAAQPEPLARTTRAFLGKPHALQLLGEHGSTRQNYPDFGELAGMRVHLNRPAMLLNDDVVTDG